MATRTVAGKTTPAHPAPDEGHTDVAEVTYLFKPHRIQDMEGVAIPEQFAQQLVERVHGVCRGASVLVDLLFQDAADVEVFDDPAPVFNGYHRGAVVGLVRHALDLLADDVLEIARRSKLCAEGSAKGGAQ